MAGFLIGTSSTPVVADSSPIITMANKRSLLLLTVNYYHKALHLGCCSSPRSASTTEYKFPKVSLVYFCQLQTASRFETRLWSTWRLDYSVLNWLRFYRMKSYSLLKLTFYVMHILAFFDFKIVSQDKVILKSKFFDFMITLSHVISWDHFEKLYEIIF